MSAERQATVIGRAIVVEMPAEAGGEKLLLIEIDITCPDCGRLQYRIAGHHLKPIRDLIIEWIDQFPALCGGKVAEVGRSTFGGTPPGDPTVN